MPRPEGVAEVLVVGGGAAGLSTAGALARRGVAATVLESGDRLGASWAMRYDALRLHTTRRGSGLAHWPIPADRPRYLTKDAFADYLCAYAKAMALDVALGERVVRVHALPEGPDGARWQVVTSRAARRARVVVIASGRCAEPVLPDVPGLGGFQGEWRHSSTYTRAADHAGRSVLVVGLGNSGAEIAADLAAHGAARVLVAVRTPPPIVKRELFGVVPVQLMGIALAPLGVPAIVDRLGALLRRLALGDLKPYGLGDAAWGAFAARRPALIDTGFVRALTQRRITVRPALAGVEGRHAIFADGSREAVDAVIAATGFRPGLAAFLDVPGLLDARGAPQCRSGLPTPAPGLYLVGFDDTVRGQLFEIRRQSMRLAATIGRELQRGAAAPTPLRAR
jgi:putative flavoprotein involved in K+ transport